MKIEIPSRYLETPETVLSSSYLDQDAYVQALNAMIIVCADALIISSDTKQIYLAKRIVHPMKGVWVIGGRIKRGERKEDAIRRHFKEDTSLDLPEDRFKLIALHEHLWQIREQDPRNWGTHDISFTFTVELSPEERAIAAGHLSPKEYDTVVGLQPFNEQGLKEAGAHQGLVDLYHSVFGSPGRELR